MKKFQNILFRYGFGTLGLFFVALGVALSIISNLGTSPLSAPAYVLSPIGGGFISVGNWTIIVNTLYIFIQLAVLRKNFKWAYLMQIPATVVFGYLIDFSMYIFGWLNPAGILSRLGLIVISCFVTALGISIEVVARGWMLSAETTVYAFSKTLHRPFNRVKIVMDCLHVVISCSLAFILYRNPFGFGQFESVVGVLTGRTEGIVIGIGTVMMAFLAGGFMKLTDPIVDKVMDKILTRMIAGTIDKS